MTHRNARLTPVTRAELVERVTAGVVQFLGYRRDCAVPAHHQVPDRTDAPPDQRASGCGPHRDGLAIGKPRTHGGHRSGGRGPEYLPQRGRPLQRSHRPGAGPAPGGSGQEAYRTGAWQPAFQRGPVLTRGDSHPGERRAGRRLRRALRFRRGPGGGAGTPGPTVPQVLTDRR